MPFADIAAEMGSVQQISVDNYLICVQRQVLFRIGAQGYGKAIPIFLTILPVGRDRDSVFRVEGGFKVRRPLFGEFRDGSYGLSDRAVKNSAQNADAGGNNYQRQNQGQDGTLFCPAVAAEGVPAGDGLSGRILYNQRLAGVGVESVREFLREILI